MKNYDTFLKAKTNSKKENIILISISSPAIWNVPVSSWKLALNTPERRKSIVFKV